MKNYLIVFCVFVLAACSPATLTTSFNPGEASFINAPGTAVVSGQAFMRRNDGVVVYAAGSEVNLIPVTTYSTERMNVIYGATKFSAFGRSFKNDDQAYYQYMKTVIADGEGRFAFAGVPNGSYFVVTSVQWLAGNMPQGGALMERVTITGGANAEVILRGY